MSKSSRNWACLVWKLLGRLVGVFCTQLEPLNSHKLQNPTNINKNNTTWDNVISACTSCNVRKGRRLLKYSDMRLEKMPLKPTSEQLQHNGRNFPPNYLHESWRDYLYWDTELEN